jgi:hypothetical protein
VSGGLDETQPALGASGMAPPVSDAPGEPRPVSSGQGEPRPVSGASVTESQDRLIRLAGAGMAATFAVVGAIFLAIPDQVLAAFDYLARGLGWPQSPTEAHTLFLALAVGYMYVVTVLAVQLARRPREHAWPWLLAQAKGVSALLSLALFLFGGWYLICLANFLVDGSLAAGVWWLCLRGRAPAARPAFSDERP